MRVRATEYPQLRQLCWNRPGDVVLGGADALALYERNWRFIDEAALDDHERDLIARLVERHGAGALTATATAAATYRFSATRRASRGAVLSVLREIDGDLFAEAQCVFGGDTAIVIALGEYRESTDIEIVCASMEGYRHLREAIWTSGMSGLTRGGVAVETVREWISDQYGIRTVLAIGGTRVRFEIAQEVRIDISGTLSGHYGVPVLDRTDMYVAKLLANDDRRHDACLTSRDVIDLAMMVSSWGPIPEVAWQKAEEAYGETVREAYASEVDRVRDPAGSGPA